MLSVAVSQWACQAWTRLQMQDGAWSSELEGEGA